jgi:hypothetical protein
MSCASPSALGSDTSGGLLRFGDEHYSFLSVVIVNGPDT